MEYTYKGYKIKIQRDDYTDWPREWDNLGTIAYNHNRHTLGEDRVSWEEIKSLIKRKDVISLPYYLLDHSTLRVSTKNFNDQWDSRLVGIIYVTKEKARKDLGIKKITKEWENKIEEYLNNEVETMDQYFRGDVYGYIIEDSFGNDLDSCWGFYGEDYCKQQAEDIVDTYIPKSIKFVNKIVKDEDILSMSLIG